jgi:hypothetical protein
MKVRRWRQKAADREEWASVTKEAKAPRGPDSGGVSKQFGIYHRGASDGQLIVMADSLCL